MGLKVFVMTQLALDPTNAETIKADTSMPNAHPPAHAQSNTGLKSACAS